jgi:hypothetical protein
METESDGSYTLEGCMARMMAGGKDADGFDQRLHFC